MEEKIIKCKDCGRLFLLSVKHQEWYLSKGCTVCREKRRKEEHIMDIIYNHNFYALMMQPGGTMKRNVKHHTDDFRGYMSNRKTIVF